mgnify:CR=1 FL=1|jgi:hypothetical protein
MAEDEIMADWLVALIIGLCFVVSKLAMTRGSS